MSAPEVGGPVPPVRPPADRVAAEVTRAARLVVRLENRQRSLLVRLRQVGDDLRAARRALRQLAADQAPVGSEVMPAVGEEAP